MPGGVTTAIWQGRGGIMLGTDDEPMCRNLEAVEAALRIGAESRTPPASTRKPAARSTTDCAYQAQKAPAGKADVVFAAHETLFDLPKAIGKGFGLVIIDEGFWQDGITTKPRSPSPGLTMNWTRSRFAITSATGSTPRRCICAT